MAHYVFQRNNGFGDFDYITNFETMEITDYKEYAAQVDDEFIGYIDIPYLNSLGFFAVGISTLALRINQLLNFRPIIRGFRPLVLPRAPRARGAAPRPMPGRPVPPPRPMARPAARPMAPKPAPRPKVAAPKPVVPKPAGGPMAPKPAPKARPASPKKPGGTGRGGRGPFGF